MVGRAARASAIIDAVNKAFTKEPDGDSDEDDDISPALVIPKGAKNYITPWGWRRMKSELKQLVEVDRPEVTRVVSWAASNGDRSENGDYLYGKRRLREIDRRIRYLMKRLEIAEVVDPRDQPEPDRVFFGATVRYADDNGTERTISIVGIDEVDPGNGRVSWISPVARTLIKSREGDTVSLRTPAGVSELEILEIRYVALE
jgi:transcription elongation factor GreB